MIASQLNSSAQPAVRIRPVPPLEPPFDDERSPGAWWRETAGQLALDLSDAFPGSASGGTRRSTVAATAAAGATASATPGARVADNRDAGGDRRGPGGAMGRTTTDRRGTGNTATDDRGAGGATRSSATGGRRPGGAGGGQRTGGFRTAPHPRAQTSADPRAPLGAPGSPGPGAAAYASSLRRLPAEALVTAGGEARQAARRILACCVEIIDGHRPIGHVRWLSEAANHAMLVGQLTAAVRRLARPAAAAGQRTGGLRVRVLRVSEPLPGGAEVTAALGRGDRSWALAMRIDRSQAGWRASRIHLL